ncbi:MAG TPA: hypothetical protein VNG51_00020 [Ktedonobacteraceae bacterium]|nr:hypothetical protein [Ktedonobacteraceae bacterium]
MTFKLAIDVAPPDMTFTESLYKCLKQRAWENVRQLVQRTYQFRCALCGADEKGLNCHEVWSFSIEDETRKLIEVLPLCRMCHAVRHMDMQRFLQSVGFDTMKEHFMSVNGCSLVEFDEYYQQHQNEAEKLVSLGTDKIIWWKTDYGQYTSIVAQLGNLRKGYVWENGYMVYHVSMK